MKITVISVGKIKEKYIVDGIKEYTKRLSRYTSLEFIEIKDESTPDSLSEADQVKVKEIEGERILQKLNSSSYVFVLAIKGKQMSSEDFARSISEVQTYQSSHITFVIGGSLGLSEQMINKANEMISFGSLTYPHQLMKLILVEQIYRAFRINNNEPYHK